MACGERAEVAGGHGGSGIERNKRNENEKENENKKKYVGGSVSMRIIQLLFGDYKWNEVF